MNDNSQNRIYLIGFFLILALPLLNLPPWFSPPDWGKTIIFRIVLSILIFLFIYRLLFQKTDVQKSTTVGFWHGVKNRRNKVFLPFWLLVALLGIYSLATIFSLDPYFSFWGSPDRSGGFLNFSFYIIFAVLALLIIRRKDWQKIWIFTIFIGILVSIIAIFQQFNIFSKVIIPFSGRTPSTMGGPIFLALYLLLLVFITFSFLLKEKERKKKLFYLSALLLFFYVILITGSRAAYFGLLIGSFYFFFLYSVNLVHPKRKTLFLLLKILIGILLIISAYGVYYLNNQPEFPQFIQDNKILKQVASRLSIRLALDDPRFSVWKVSLEAVKERPILGYGPENFSIGFDKYYDPSLPYIDIAWGSWYDRAHNFLFDIAVTAGIPALIIYLSLIGALFWQLQKLKYNPNPAPEQSSVRGRSTNNAIIAHGLQAAFIGYLAANFFSFDTFSTYLILFLLISYSLHLISYYPNLQMESESANKNKKRRGVVLWRFYKYRKLIISLLFICLIWFIWSYNIKPLQINSQINIAKYLVDDNKCEQAFRKMDKNLAKKSFLNNHLRLKYAGFMTECEKQHPDKSLEYAKKGVPFLKENIKIRPYYTRNWLLLGGFTTVLIAQENDLEKRQELIKEDQYYLEKAEELSPKRQQVFIEWSKYGIASGKYQIAKEKAQKCIDVNPNLSDCYWLMGLTQGYLENFEEFNSFIALAQKKGYNINSKESLSQLINVYIKTENYQGLAETYSKLISIEPKNAQFHAYLAVVYKELGEIEKAKKEALKVLELQPEAKAEIEEFLRSLE